MKRLLWIALCLAPALACVGDDPTSSSGTDAGSTDRNDAASSSGGGSEQDSAAIADAAVTCTASMPFDKIESFSEVNTDANELDLRFSTDGLLAYFVRARTAKNTKIFVASRAEKFLDKIPLTAVNSMEDDDDGGGVDGGNGTADGAPTLAPDGLEILFHSDGAFDEMGGGIRVWHATRSNTSESFSNREPVATLAGKYGSPIFVADGNAVYMTQVVTGAPNRVLRAPRKSRGDYGTAVIMMTDAEHPAITGDELTLYFSRRVKNADVMMVATRATLGEPFGLPVEVEGPAGRPSWVSSDGCTLVFVGPKADTEDFDISIARKGSGSFP